MTRQMSASGERPPTSERAGSGSCRTKRFGHAATIAAVVLLGALSYANALGNGFAYDDVPSIVENRNIQDLGRFFSDGWRQRQNREVAYFSFTVNYAAGGLDPVGYHAVNVVIHLLNAALVYALVVLLFRTPRARSSLLAASAQAIAFVAALLFVTHPIQTEAVTYVVQRLTSLTTTFYLGAVVLYLVWRLADPAAGSVGRGAAYVGAVTSAVLAMYTKQIAFTLPLAIGLAEAVFFDGGRRRALPLLPFLATMLIIPVSVLGGPSRPLATMIAEAELPKVQTEVHRAAYLATQAHVVASYLGLVALPVGQNVDHDHPVYDTVLRAQVLAPAALLATLVLLAAWLLFRQRRGEAATGASVAAFGILWFFLALSVESTLIPIVDVMVEHRVYLPSVGLFIAIAVGASAVARRLVPARADRMLAIVGAVLALVLGAATFRRNTVWESELTLWADAVAKSPRKARPLNNLGAALADQGRTEEAIDTLRRAIQFNPDHADSYYNLGRVRLLRLEDYDGAIALFRTAIGLRPGYPEAYASLSAAMLRLRRFGEVVSLLQSVPEVVSQRAEAQFNLAIAYVALGDIPAAERQYVALEQSSPELAASLRPYLSAAGAR